MPAKRFNAGGGEAQYGEKETGDNKANQLMRKQVFLCTIEPETPARIHNHRRTGWVVSRFFRLNDWFVSILSRMQSNKILLINGL